MYLQTRNALPTDLKRLHHRVHFLPSLIPDADSCCFGRLDMGFSPLQYARGNDGVLAPAKQLPLHERSTRSMTESVFSTSPECVAPLHSAYHGSCYLMISNSVDSFTLSIRGRP